MYNKNFTRKAVVVTVIFRNIQFANCCCDGNFKYKFLSRVIVGFNKYQDHILDNNVNNGIMNFLSYFLKLKTCSKLNAILVIPNYLFSC